jgi:hypothetical protein
MKNNQTTYTLIFSIFVGILAICLFVFFLRVIKNKNIHTSAVLSTLENKMQDKEDALKFSEKIAEIKTLEDSMNSRFLDPEKIDTFVNYLEKIGQDIGSILLVNNIEIPTKIKNKILFRVSIEGKFGEVIRTITLLENIPYQINITQVYINKNMKKQIQKEDENGKLIMIEEEPKWQADVFFSILSSR